MCDLNGELHKCVFIVLWNTNRCEQYDWLSPSCENLQFYERNITIHRCFVHCLFIYLSRKIVFKKNMFCVPSLPSENLAKVCENSPAGENPRLHLRFSLICSNCILSKVCLSFHQAMKTWRTFLSYWIPTDQMFSKCQ